PKHARQALAHTLAWLDHPVFGVAPEAQFVLHAFLKRQDPGPEHGPRAIARAFAWLGHGDNALSWEAGFVLPPLLDRQDFPPLQARGAITCALTWLQVRIRDYPRDALYVVGPLLKRQEMDAEQAAQAMEHALVLLAHDEVAHSPDASFTLQALLRRGELDRSRARRAAEITLQWLRHEQHSTSRQAAFVLPALLEQMSVPSGLMAQAVNLSLVWLEVHAGSVDAEFVLKALLLRSDIDGPSRQRLQLFALGRVTHLLETENANEASFLLQACLRDRRMDSGLDAPLIRSALVWISRYHDHADAQYVFNRLLRKHEVEDEDWKQVARVASDWLATHALTDEIDFTINSLLVRAYLLTPAQLGLVLQKGLNWILNSSVSAHARRMLLSKLVYAADGTEFAANMNEIASKWLPQVRQDV
ncbi:MAG TPA: hypothetical protein VEQ60_04060, partial [Longimicrobium sp.]|nr:hypothetical protein [Longimicrobium sp.]